nr:methylenetetrahydrofolate reductase [Alphaproteobacteria bacterium]
MSQNFSLSIEVMPPRLKSGDKNRIKNSFALLKFNLLLTACREFNPDFISVTYRTELDNDLFSARTSTRRFCGQVRERNMIAVPHLTAVGKRGYDAVDVADEYYNDGMRSVLLLRGDLPENGEFGLQYHDAHSLVNAVVHHRAKNDLPAHDTIYVAAQPQPANKKWQPKTHWNYLRNKMQTALLSAENSAAITQICLDEDAFARFMLGMDSVNISPTRIISSLLPIHAPPERMRNFLETCEIPFERELAQAFKGQPDHETGAVRLMEKQIHRRQALGIH